MKKIGIAIIAVVLLATASVFAEVVTCPHCGKDFDTASATAKKTTVDSSEYQVVTITRLNAMGKNYVGKKVCLENVRIGGIWNDGTCGLVNEDFDRIIVYFPNSLAEKIIDLHDSRRYVNFYGTVKSDGWGRPEFYIESIR